MATITKAGQHLTIKLDSGHAVSLDLSKHNLSSEQLLAVEKAARALSNSPDATLLGSGCPAKAHLADDEFQRLKGLKASLGSTGGEIAAGVFMDFCLHVVKVGN
jgi:hypothetical protein